MKPNINSVKVCPQLSNNRRPVDGEMVRDSLLWPLEATFIEAGNKLLNGCVAFNTSYATSFLKMDLSSPFWRWCCDSCLVCTVDFSNFW